MSAPQDSTMSLDEGPSDSTAKVTWQTAFWILVALATAVMSQPAGRICSLPSRHRTYLRSSPIICLADVASLLLAFGCSVLCHRVPPRVCLETIIRIRYDDVSDLSEGIQSLETMSILRWAFFILCSLPPAIKLLCMSNLPWTQAYGAMFLVSFVVIEGLAFLKRRENATNSSPLREDPYSQLDLISGYVLVCSRIAFVVAFSIHISLLIWALNNIWPIPADATGQLLVLRLPYRLILEGALLFITLHLACIYALLVFIVIVHIPIGILWFLGETEPYLLYADRASNPAELFVYFVFGKFAWASIATPSMLAAFWLIWGSYDMDLELVVFLKWVSIDYGIMLVATAGPVVMALAIRKASERWKGLGRKLLVVVEETDRVDKWSCWGLVFFLTNLTLCTVWYSYGYNPAGTVNPSWTGVFG